MTLSNALSLGKDLAALLAGVSLILAAAVLWSSAGAVTVSLALAAAIAALGGVATVAVIGGLSLLGAPPLISIGGVVALFAAGAFYAALAFGVRGLWISAIAMIGAALALVLLGVFARSGSFGPAGPLIALFGMALVAAGALGAAAHAPSASARPATSRTLASLVAPPQWFDCAYAALGGSGLRPEGCAVAPGEAAPGLSEAPNVALISTEDAPKPLAAIAQPSALDETMFPTAALTPPAPEQVEPPVFTKRDEIDASISVESPMEPDLLDAAPPPDIDQTPDKTPTSPSPASELAPLAATPNADAAATNVDALSNGASAMIASASGLDLQKTAPRPDIKPQADTTRKDRRVSAYVCFPLLDAHADKLCPDRRMSAENIAVSWTTPESEAKAAIEGVECAIDQNVASHATMIVALPSDPKRPLSKGAGDGGSKPIGDAIYDSTLSLISAARAKDGLNQLYLSTFFPNGSRLAGAWASHNFGVGRSDRIFEVGSGGQTLAMMRRLKSELQAPRALVSGEALKQAVAEAASERPAATTQVGQDMIILIVDAVETSLSKETAALAAQAAKKSGIPLFVVAISEDGEAPEAFQRLAEDAGGAAFGAADAANLSAALERALLRARSFCAVRVTAPQSFFDSGPVEINVRRKLVDGCALRQVATLSCSEINLRSEVVNE